MKNTLSNWTAKRAGAAITITGTDGTGAARKITGITDITHRNGVVLATDKAGAEYTLTF